MPSHCGVGEKTLENPLDCKEIKPVSPKGNQPWVFIRTTDAETEAPILWPSDEKSWLIGKDLDAGKDWRQEEKETTENEVVGWHHWLNGHEFEQTKGDSGGQRCLAVYGIVEGWAQLSYWTHVQRGLKRSIMCFYCLSWFSAHPLPWLPWAMLEDDLWGRPQLSQSSQQTPAWNSWPEADCHEMLLAWLGPVWNKSLS